MKKEKNKERYYTITMNEHQFCLMINCIEDISRFMAGQTELFHTILNLPNYLEVKGKMEELAQYITPDLPHNASYGWSGGGCPNEAQAKFIAETYYLYREMLHQYTLANNIDNVYTSSTLRCKDSGEPIKVTWTEKLPDAGDKEKE